MWDREGWLEHEGLRLRYLEKGQGEPVVLLHGFGDAAEVWEFLLPYLPMGFRFIALDQRGHGESSRAPLDRYRTFDFVQDIEALRSALGIEGLILVGHSMGGRNALVYAAQRPERVKGLVVIDYGPDLLPEGRRRIIKALRERPDRFTLEEMAKALMEEDPRLDHGRAIEYLRRVTKPATDGLFLWRCDLRLLELMRQGKRVIRDVDLREFLPRVPCPTLILRGAESDLLGREGAREMADLLPLASLEEVPGAGHAVTVDNPEGTAKALTRFLLRLVGERDTE